VCFYRQNSRTEAKYANPSKIREPRQKHTNAREPRGKNNIHVQREHVQYKRFSIKAYVSHRSRNAFEQRGPGPDT